MKPEFAEVAALIGQVPKAPDEEIPVGAQEKDIDAAEASVSLKFPHSLREWLGIANGPCVGPGGLFGVRTKRRSLNIEEILSIYPEWKELGWIPIAGDGSGNYYVLATKHHDSDEPPVLFIDTADNHAQPAYIVASSLIRFLLFLLKKELGQDGWPFQEREVLSADPDLAIYREYTMPWEA